MRRILPSWFALLLMMLSPVAHAQPPVVPSWITANSGEKTAVFDLEAGWNSNNGTLNYNGYANGEIRIVVPLGWRITVKLFNPDLTLAHSAIITKPYAKGEFPNEASGREAAIPRAYTSSPERGMFNSRDEFDFTASDTRVGDYYLFCGVSTHGVAGMWLNFSIRADAESPHIVIEKEPAKPGRS